MTTLGIRQISPADRATGFAGQEALAELEDGLERQDLQ